MHGIAKGLADSPDGGAQAIGADQQRTMRGTAMSPLNQPPEQCHVALLTDLTAKPQARLDHHGQRHPHDVPLFLDTDRIGLHLSKGTWLLDQILVHDLALTARASPPRCHGALVEPKSRDDRLERTPIGEQGYDEATVSAEVRSR